MNTASLLWWVQTTAKKLGFWGLLGLLLLAICAFVYWVKIPALQSDIDAAITAQANLDQQRQDQRLKSAQDPAQQEAKEAATFYTRFPQLTAVPALLGRLHALAKQHHLRLEIGDYRYKKIKSASAEPLTQYKMTFPIEGRYTDIRQFIDYALSENPELALLDLQVVREDRHTATVTARIVFAAYVKGKST